MDVNSIIILFAIPYLLGAMVVAAVELWRSEPSQPPSHEFHTVATLHHSWPAQDREQRQIDRDIDYLDPDRKR
jgi:hypothetical protein